MQEYSCIIIHALKLFYKALYCTSGGLKFQKTVVFLTLLRFLIDGALYGKAVCLRSNTTIIETERL